MSTVNKYNYEAVLLDFAEGRLSATETDMLFDFLAANPELQEDFDAALELLQLQESELPAFSAKNSLLQDETLDAKQNLIIANLENVASEEERESLTTLLIEDNTMQQEYTLFSKMKLEADESIVYMGKDVLIQTISISYATWIYRATYAAAAVVIMILAFNSVKFDNHGPHNGLASNTLPKLEWTKKSAPIINTKAIVKHDYISEATKVQDVFEIHQAPFENPIALQSIDPIANVTATLLRDDNYNETIAELAPISYGVSEKRDEIPSLLDRIANESSAFNLTYGFAESMAKKLKTAKGAYAENDYIEINIWKVHTQIRKPSWMKTTRR